MKPGTSWLVQGNAAARWVSVPLTFYATGLARVLFSERADWKQRTYPYDFDFGNDDDELQGAIVLDLRSSTPWAFTTGLSSSTSPVYTPQS